MIDYKKWKEDIYSAIENISDKAYQEEVWLGKSKDFVSSFVEVICILFDDLCFKDEFWKPEHIIHFNFSQKLIKEMQLLIDMIDNYKEKPTDEEILKDPEWDKVVEQAKRVIALWDITKN